jgi:uncharacterized protein YaeQ
MYSRGFKGVKMSSPGQDRICGACTSCQELYIYIYRGTQLTAVYWGSLLQLLTCDQAKLKNA